MNAKGLQLQCARVLNEILFPPVLMHGSETVVWKKKERSAIRAEPMDTLMGLSG